MRPFTIAFALLAVLLTPLQALTEQELQTFINDAIKAGGGEVVIPPGTHVITKGLMVKDAKKLRIIGIDMERTILKLPPLVFAETATAAKAGDMRLATKRMQGMTPGLQIQIEADGETDAFTKKPKPYQLAVVEKVEGDALVLKSALQFAVPAGTLIRDPNAPNLMEIRGATEGVSIEKLTLDGGRVAGDPPVRGHAQLCGVFAQGPYTYEKGVTGPRVKDLTISRCVIQNCHGRGVALYAVEGAHVEDCTIMDTTDEAVDLDHFTIKTVVRHNHIARSGVAIEMNDATDCEVTANECRDSATGITLWRWCKMPELNQGNVITGNTFENMKGNGIQISKDTMRNTITDNDILNSGRNGISVAGQAQVVKNNRIKGSKLKDIAIGEPGAVVE